MRISSFDIGIKHLAFSIIDIEGEKHSIIAWNVINVLSEIEESCSIEGCERPATHTCVTDSTSDDSSKTVAGCCAKVKCIKAFDAKYPPSAYPRTAIKKRHAVRQHSLMELCHCILNSLERYKKLVITSDVIVLENQPVLKNPTMKSIQMFIFSYLLIHGAKNIALFNARFKLNEYSGPEVNVSHKKTEYAKRKALSVAYAKTIMNSERCSNGGESSIWNVIFEGSKKKDDLADCYLQGLTYYREKYMTSNKKATGSRATKAKKEKNIATDSVESTGSTSESKETKRKPRATKQKKKNSVDITNTTPSDTPLE
jgi:hypothetical protein